MKKFLLGLLVLVLVGTGCVVTYLLFTGPRMRTQAHITTFEAVLPAMAPGSYPTTATFSIALISDSMTNPLHATPENIARGRIYYEYYCVFCHGDNGDGSGPVGQSYVPAPSDLRQAKWGGYPDGKFVKAMLTGTGHDPVLGRVVSADYYWYLEAYVKTLSQGKGK